ncbi:MAG TPA: acetyl-CoA carboxylase biotin carboxyl carrier protein [Tepidisphaeraceae bacterium]|nr:acetyl-CoA carboxylase biotin carboxyl carrier protein [Tepidisphaeraceae bacterium]
MSQQKPKRKASKPSQPPSAAPTADAGGPLDIGVLENLVQLMRANDLTTVEVADGDRRILLKRGGDAAPAAAHAPSHAAPKAAPAAPAAPPPADAGLVPIKSVMVGTYYAAPSPEAQPFVKVGSHVDEETDVCVIEAMKVFNTIKAECKGTIARILVSNGESVEFGQPLFLVKPH